MYFWVFVTVWLISLDKDILGFFVIVHRIISVSNFPHAFVRLLYIRKILANSTDSPKQRKESSLSEGQEIKNFCFQLDLCPHFGLKSTWIQNTTISCIAYTLCFPAPCSIFIVNYPFDQGQNQRKTITIFYDELLKYVN